jgi:hypothetical protein
MKLTARAMRWIAAAAVAAGTAAVVPSVALATPAVPGHQSAPAFTPVCETPDLVIWLNTAGSGTAGSIFYHLNFTNLSGHACTINGKPFLFAVNLANNKVGKTAGFRGPVPNLITLGNHKTAFAVLQVEDTGVFSPTLCKPVLAAGFKVFPPNQTRAKIVPFPVRVCTQIVSLRVGPVRL